MIRLVAYSAEDGWAFVREGGTILRIRPPYRRDDTVSVDEQTLERAISRYGFAETTQPFHDYHEVILYLRNEVAESRSGEGTASDTQIRDNLIQILPVDRLDSIVDRVEILVNREKTSAATKLAASLLKHQGVSASPQLQTRLALLLERAQEIRDSRDMAYDDLVRPNGGIRELFRRASERHGPATLEEFADRIKRQGHPLAFGIS